MSHTRLAYDEVRSPTIRAAIRTGSIDDPDHRRLVDDLVYVEWFTREGLSPNATGISRAGALQFRWRVALTHPEAYDDVRRDLDATTRAEYAFAWNGREDRDERRRWARRHRDEWDAVVAATDPPGGDDLDDRPAFAPFRFPTLPYDELHSPFVRDELGRGSFDDFEHRQFVNRLVAIEAFARRPRLFGCGCYPPVTPWIVGALHPDEFDIIRRELGASTRADLVARPVADDPYQAPLPPDERRAWRAVQEGDER